MDGAAVYIQDNIIAVVFYTGEPLQYFLTFLQHYNDRPRRRTVVSFVLNLNFW